MILNIPRRIVKSRVLLMVASLSLASLPLSALPITGGFIQTSDLGTPSINLAGSNITIQAHGLSNSIGGGACDYVSPTCTFTFAISNLGNVSPDALSFVTYNGTVYGGPTMLLTLIMSMPSIQVTVPQQVGLPLGQSGSATVTNFPFSNFTATASLTMAGNPIFTGLILTGGGTIASNQSLAGGIGDSSTTYTFTSVPEPESVVFFVTGLGSLLAWRSRKRA